MPDETPEEKAAREAKEKLERDEAEKKKKDEEREKRADDELKDTVIIDRFFLELSRFTKVQTEKEVFLICALKRIATESADMETRRFAYDAIKAVNND